VALSARAGGSGSAREDSADAAHVARRVCRGPRRFRRDCAGTATALAQLEAVCAWPGSVWVLRLSSR